MAAGIHLIPASLLLHEEFDIQARSTPESLAVFDRGRSITFGDLQARTDHVAAGLRSRKIGGGALIGLHIERSIEWVVAIIGILKSGAAVVPLPPSDPAGRIGGIIAFGGLDAVLDARETPLDPALARRIFHLLDFEEDLSNPGDFASARPGDPAFVLSSSGSTGHPKLIVRSHRSFFHRLDWTWSEQPFSAGEIACQKAHMTTTHAIYELFEPLLRGVPVVIVPEADVRDLESFWITVERRGVSRLLLVPSALRASLDLPGFCPPVLNVVILMGEQVDREFAARAVAAFDDRTRLYSIYGSTEASSALVVDLRGSFRGGELPLGAPIRPEIQALVLDPSLEPVAPGEEGRLYLGGPLLFSGYLKDPELTRSALLDRPGGAGPIYDTHDRVRQMHDGEIQFIGRVDHVVKVRGFRVDVPEVERAIREQPGVREAAVAIDRDEAGNALLLGFVTPADLDVNSVYELLRERLAPYMVPSGLFTLGRLPHTSSGKVDRLKLLAERSEHTAKETSDADETPTARQVAESWRRTLKHRLFLPDSSFFEVGGTSLSVFSLVLELRASFGLDQALLTAESVYRFPTITALAGHIDAVQSGAPLEEGRGTPLTVILRRGRDPDLAPFFVIASAGGTLGAYEKLARTLKCDREVIGVRDPFVWGARDPTAGFGAWVNGYLDAIRERQPAGPYYLGAYSSAGAFGYEIARRLRAEGQEVAILALIDPLALDRGTTRRFGSWALRAIWMRPPGRMLVRLVGRLRSPWVRIQTAIGESGAPNDYAPGDEELRQFAETAVRNKSHLMTLSALLELNTGLPFALNDGDFLEVPAERYSAVLRGRVVSLTPEVDPATIDRIVVQYDLQVRAQHAYQLGKYDGTVLLVEPVSRYAGLIATLLRPHVRDLHTRQLGVAQPAGRTRALAERFGALRTHYLCMRDEGFVRQLASELDALL